MSALPNIAVLTYEPPPITVVTDSQPFVVLPDSAAITVVTDEEGVVVAVNDMPPAITLVPDSAGIVVASAEPEIAIVIAPGLQGPPGADGTGTGGDDTAEINASENIAALSFVTAGGETADSSNLSHFNHVIGITMDPVTSGFIATCVVEGEVTDLSWTWTANQKLFLNGTTLSTTPVTTGFSQLVGITRNNHTVFIRLQVPIKL